MAMIGNGRRRASMPVLAALILLGSLGAGPGSGPDVDQSHGRLDAVVTARDAMWSAPGAALDTRLQRDRGVGPGQRTSRHDGLAGAASLHRSLGPTLPRLAAVLERAGHPERLGEILLRGPPAPSA